MRPEEANGVWLPDGKLVVELSKDDLERAAKVGRARQDENVRNQRERGGKFVARKDDPYWQDEIGAQCELAVSNAFRAPWDGAFFEEPLWQAWRRLGHDVGPFEVRGTGVPNLELPVRRTDDKRAPFIRVFGDDRPRFVIAGWRYGHEVWKGEGCEFKDPGNRGAPAWWCPIERLRPIAELFPILCPTPAKEWFS